jgi:SAM-dependent methyltransferase
MDRSWEERADPRGRTVTHTEDEHRARYLWASNRVTGRVLDLACGTGYGSQILARVCDVTGVDRDQTAVRTAQARVAAGSFQVAEVPPISCEDGRFDHAVCFETIEHVERDGDLVAELRRVVAPGGHLLISTPNRAMSSPNHARPQNPYHAREYLLPEFVALLRSGGFEHVDVYFQRKERRRAPEYLASAVVARLPWLCQPGRWWDRLAHGSSEVEPWRPEVTHPMFWLLDCY